MLPLTKPPTLTLRSKGPEQYPFAGNADDDFSPVSNRMMAGLGLYPVYTYQKGVNVIQIKLRKKPKSPLFHLLIAAIMLAHLTIPQGALELILILDVFFDFLATGFGMVYLQCELLLQAQKMRLIDSAKLKA